MKTIINTALLLLLLSSCTNPVKTRNLTEATVRQQKHKVSSEYLLKLSRVTGRLDGMNRAVVNGLTESLSAARSARELAEEALSVAQENKTSLKALIERVDDQEKDLETVGETTPTSTKDQSNKEGEFTILE